MSCSVPLRQIYRAEGSEVRSLFKLPGPDWTCDLTTALISLCDRLMWDSLCFTVIGSLRSGTTQMELRLPSRSETARGPRGRGTRPCCRLFTPAAQSLSPWDRKA
ncbi:unnamed protein product [Pleuronectes platessa]|uniref:Uncharacterized protein n=1 Tax=Pleuronectes platessa TaxID=8262 RepID=A0A9N7VNE5_PLEPL|nr:unnamed protein product [Pleuronectes platessa]